jgi:hypothetical protein
VGSTQPWGAQEAGRWGSWQVLLSLHTPTPIFVPLPSWDGKLTSGPCFPTACLAARSPLPPASACWPPPFVLRRHGPCGASVKPLADAQGPELLPGNTRAMAWESPRSGGGAVMQAHPAPLAWRGWGRGAGPQPEAAAEVALGRGWTPERGGGVERERLA